MSTFKATVIEIQSEDILHIVSFKVGKSTLKMMSLELQSNLKVGSSVLLSVKATAVALAKELSGMLSYSNQILLEIQKIEQGKLLSSIKLKNQDISMESVITTASCERMQLKETQSVIALIKSSDLSICEVL